MDIQQNICKNCGNQFTGLYCNLCGEKVLVAQDRSFRTFLGNIVLAVTLADSKFIRSLWFLVKSPGFISKEFAEGRRVKYLKPLSVFFVLNLIYFLFPIIQLFNASLRTQINAFHGKLAIPIVAAKMNELGHSGIASFSVIYDQKTTALAKLMVIVFVIISSLPLNLIYRSRNRYFTDHLGLAVELACFNLAINAILLTVTVNILGLGAYLDEAVLTGIFISTNLYFLVRSGRVFYDERGLRLVLKSVLMILVLKASLELYRAILFYVTIWSL